MNAEFIQLLETARSIIQIAGRTPFRAQKLNEKEKNQSCTEIILAINCLIYASQPKPLHD